MSATQQDLVLRAMEFYPTPFYLFDEICLLRTVNRLRTALPANASLCYAMKANPFVVRSIIDKVDRIEVCSPGELRICQDEEVPLGKTVISGVYKDADLMRELMADDANVCRYTVESVSQFDMLEAMAFDFGVQIPILIRLTSGNQFGIDEDCLRMLAMRAQTSKAVNLCGIQYFSGTQKRTERQLERELSRLDDILMDMEHELGLRVNELEYGAGLAVEYFEPDIQAQLREDGQLRALAMALRRMRFGGQVIIELGRAMVASCGSYATRVVDVKRNNGYNFAIVDGGIHQIAYFGHGLSLRRPPCRFILDRPQEGNEDVWTICGSLCTTSDVIAKQMPCGNLCVGDVVLFERAGAYCMTEGCSLLLSRNLPRILIADYAGDIRQARRTIETYPLNRASS